MIDPNAAAPGTPGDPPDDSSASAEDLQERIAKLEAEGQSKDQQIERLLSERSNVEAGRREVSGIREQEAQRAEIQRQMNLLQNGDPSEKAIAAAYLLPFYGAELQAAKQEINQLRQRTQTEIPEGLPTELEDAAYQSFERGDYNTLQEAINAKVGEAVLAGKWTPPGKAEPPPPPPPPAPRPNGAAPVAPRPAPAITRQPIQTVTRSRLPEATDLPPSMTESQYLALPPGEFERAYQARKAGRMTLTPG